MAPRRKYRIFSLRIWRALSSGKASSSSPICFRPECMRRKGSVRSSSRVMSPSRKGRAMVSSSCPAWAATTRRLLATPRTAQIMAYSSQKPMRYSASPMMLAWGTRCSSPTTRARRAFFLVLRCQERTVRRQRTLSSHRASLPGPRRFLRLPFFLLTGFSSSCEGFKTDLLSAPKARTQGNSMV